MRGVGVVMRKCPKDGMKKTLDECKNCPYPYSLKDNDHIRTCIVTRGEMRPPPDIVGNMESLSSYLRFLEERGDGELLAIVLSLVR